MLLAQQPVASCHEVGSLEEWEAHHPTSPSMVLLPSSDPCTHTHALSAGNGSSHQALRPHVSSTMALSEARCAHLQAILHPDAHEEGGLACNDKKLLAEMREYVLSQAPGSLQLSTAHTMTLTPCCIKQAPCAMCLQQLLGVQCCSSADSAPACSPVGVAVTLHVQVHHAVDQVHGQTGMAEAPGSVLCVGHGAAVAPFPVLKHSCVLALQCKPV